MDDIEIRMRCVELIFPSVIEEFSAGRIDASAENQTAILQNVNNLVSFVKTGEIPNVKANTTSE